MDRDQIDRIDKDYIAAKRLFVGTVGLAGLIACTIGAAVALFAIYSALCLLFS
jgi:hypothetical protein